MPDSKKTGEYLGDAKFVAVGGNRGGGFKRSNTKLDRKERAKRRAVHHPVKVCFSSLWQAWKVLNLPTSHHQPFRKKLKEDRRLTYRIGEKSYDFEVAEPKVAEERVGRPAQSSREEVRSKATRTSRAIEQGHKHD